MSPIRRASNDLDMKVLKAIDFYSDSGDTLILISADKSPNMVNAANFAKNKINKIITFLK